VAVRFGDAAVLMRYVSSQQLRVDATQSIDTAERAVRSGAAQAESAWRQGMTSAALGGPEGMGLMMPGTQEEIEKAGQLTPAEKQAAGDKAWRKYESCIKGKKWPNDFSTYLDTITQHCEQLQNERVHDRDAWLSADTFRYALNDYDPNDAADGMAFSGVIDEAYAGLPATTAGLQIIEKVINNMDPTDEHSYFWRAFCYNQTDIRQDMKTFLARVQATKSESILNQTAAWYESKLSMFTADLGYLKSFLKFYDSMDKVLKNERTVTASERLVRNLQIDRFTVWAGRGLVNVFGPVSRTVGGKLIDGALMVRGGIALEDAKRIVVKKAIWEGQMDSVLKTNIAGIKAQNPGLSDLEVRARAYQALANDERGIVVRNLYANAKITPNATRDAATASVKLSGALFVIELLNYFMLWTKTDKTAADDLAIVSGTLSLVGASLNVYNKWLGSFAKSGANITLAGMKVASSCLGGISSFISIYSDGKKVDSGLKSGSLKQVFFYTFKTMLDVASGAVAVLTAVSSSAPLLLRYTTLSPGKARFLGKLAARVAASQAQLDGRAAGLVAEKLGQSVTSAAFKSASSFAGQGAAAEIAAEVTAEGWLLFGGRLILIATGWEVAVILTVITLIYNYFTPDDLENWLSGCPFGVSPDTGWTLETQQKAFEAALAAKGYQ
ncbi:T6SS effector BTH_I2691 family protein, partial [Paraburkholderia tropica]|uniref:T6SS effector BTH_I2691 family protein n=1 Tax=Paraburkholderia tropica TaxID=92647 RepID=UPI0007ED788D